MTKEELEKEAEEIYLKTDKEFMDCQDEGEIFNLGYLAGAEPREKQIEIDAEQIRALQKQNGELTDKVKELEAQIEKMKCCGNCIHCKYDENEESYEFCEKHNQVVNIAIQPCSEYETYNFDKAIKEIKEK